METFLFLFLIDRQLEEPLQLSSIFLSFFLFIFACLFCFYQFYQTLLKDQGM